MDDLPAINDFDYSQWQRRSISMQKVAFSMPRIDELNVVGSLASSPVVKRCESKSSSYQTTDVNTATSSPYLGDILKKRNGSNINGKRNSSSTIHSPFLKRDLESACSTLCRHLPKSEAEKGNLAEDSENMDVIRTMKFQIKAKKQCILEYKRQILNLIEDNVKLKNHIQGTEESCHNDVRGLLEKYHKLRGAMATINNEHKKQKSMTDKAFKDVKISTDSAIQELEKKLHSLRKEVERKQSNLKVLNNYKNKEYPEKIIKIKKLKKELEAVSLLNEKDIRDMSKIVEVEKAKYMDTAASEEIGVLKQAALNVYETMDANVKETASQNVRLKKEIEMQRYEKGKLENENMELERKIKALIKESKGMQTKLFPGVFQRTDKCTPDTEIELSIPRRDFLPI